MAKDPKDMTDEELEKAIETTEVEEKPVKPEDKKPDKEASQEEEPKPEEQAEEPESQEEEQEEEKPPSRREQLRIQQVLAKLKESKLPPAPTPVPDAIDYEKTLDADPELIAKLKADREATNKAMYQQGVEQARSLQFHTRLEIDAPRVEAKYPQLDKDSDKFNPALANAINTMYLEQVGFDADTDTVKTANLRYLPYVESIFELAGEIASETTADSKKKIVKQAANTGLRPDGSGTKKLNLNKLPYQMSDEELDAAIAQGIPS